MKQLVLFSIMLVCGLQLHAQSPTPSIINYFDDADSSFDAAVNVYINHLQTTNPNDTTEGGVSNAFQRWRNFWEGRLSNDAPSGTNKIKAANSALRQSLSSSGWEICNSNNYQGDWKCIGPFNNYYGNPNNIEEKQGRIDNIWVDPADTNNILIGSNSGGVWQTSNGGQSWSNITDNKVTGSYRIPGTIGVNNLTVDPLSTNTIYISTGIFTLHDVNGWSYGLGVLYSTNGGTTWQEDSNFDVVAGTDKYSRVTKMMFRPGSHELIAVVGDSKVLYKSSSSSNWTDVSPSGLPSGYRFHDFEYSKVNTNRVIFSGTDGILRIYNTTTNTWTSIAALTPNTGDVLGRDGITEITMTNGDDAIVFVHLVGTTDKRAIWSTDINTVNWQETNNNVNDGNRVFVNLEVSPTNDDIVYFTDQTGWNHFGLHRSTDGGATFTNISGNTHADGRVLYIYSTTNTTNGINDVVYAGTDGGIVKKRLGTSDFVSITGDSLCVTQFYGMSSSDANDGLLVGGAQDNGLVNYSRQRATPWNAVIVGDGFLTKFARNGVTRALGENNYPSLRDVNFATPTAPTTGGTANPSYSSCTTPFQPCANNIRPIYFRADNTQLVGYKEIHSRANFGAVWDFAFQTDPKRASNDLVSNKAAAIAIDPNNADMTYIAYRREAWTSPTGNPNANGKLYVSLNATFTPQQGPVTWTNITPPIVEYYRITDIAIDPQAPGRIWITLGNIDWGHIDKASVVGTDTVNRVFYSADTGKTWKNVSKGLPALPANNIVYQEGSDDVLYVGTDVGVFIWNKQDEQWECFMKDMPPVLVMNLEINYCSGKLRAGTWGRGVWETSVFNANSLPPKENETITANTTWAASRTINSGIRIKSGATLTINGANTTIFMPKKGLIVIEPNAKLVVNDATITNGCEDCLWGGIRVVGNLHKSQSTLDQGKVELNDATIANASYAIGNYDENKSANTTGGIIDATNTTFLNNERSVDLFEYNSSQYSAIKNYQATFTTCTFEINNDYKFDNGAGYLGTNPHRFFSHVGLFKVDGVQFKGCEFYNRNNGQYEGWGEGIMSTDGGFTVQSHCTNPNNSPCLTNDLARSQFRGFKHGIWIEKDLQKNLATKVDEAQFDSCSFGIRIVNPSYSELTRNEFTIGNGKEVDINNFDCHKNVGIFATSALAPIIEDNSFQGITHGGQHQDHENIGVVIENIGNNNVQVYKNSFDDLSKGCLALGNNDLDDHKSHVSINNKGVKFLCNSFADNTFDIYVSADPASNGHVIYGIANYQGDTKSDAGNTFSTSPTNHIYNTGAAFNYFYDPTLTNGQPTSINSVSQITVITTSDNNECPSHYNPTGGAGWNTPLTGSGLTGLKANFLTYKDKRDNAQDLLNDYIDNGNTTGLTTFIDNSMVVDTPIVRDTLIKTSPYVSEAALRSTANINILDQTVLIDILKANPEVLRNEVFLSFLENDIPNPLSSTQIDDLRTTSATSTNRTTLEAEASEYDHLMSIVANVIIGHYLLDTTTTSLDSIPGWYDSLNTLQAEYAKVAFYTGIADYSSAETAMDNIPTKFTLTQEQSDDHDVYDDLWTLFKGVLDDDRNMFQLTTAEETSLNTILTTEVSPNGGMKQIIDVITDIYGPPARLACFTSIGLGEPKRGNVINNNGNTTIYDNSILKVYPNPANDYVIFEYNFKDDINNLQLEVINTLGQSVYKQPLQGKSGRQHWNTTSIASGIYNYSITENGKKLESGKIVIQK